jgi:hypothetical protein
MYSTVESFFTCPGLPGPEVPKLALPKFRVVSQVPYWLAEKYLLVMGSQVTPPAELNGSVQYTESARRKSYVVVLACRL